MGIGSKIKEYRVKAGLTQKDLADELHVTYQAVSRWENDDAEPSFDSLKDMCKIFNCTTDDLFDLSKPNVEKEKEEPKIIERVIVKESEQKPILGICQSCTKPIYDKEDLFRVDDKKIVRTGKLSNTINEQIVLCKECKETREIKIKKAEEEKEAKRKLDIKRKRIHSFIWPSIVAVIFLVLAIVYFAKGDATAGLGGIILSILSYTFLATMILDNNFVNDLWFEVSSWGFVRMPGIIFTFDLGGLAFLIVMKILFAILAILIAIFAVIFATILAMILSVFVYPFALSKNLKYKEE